MTTSVYSWVELAAIPVLVVGLVGTRLALRWWIRTLFAARGFTTDPFDRGPDA